MPDIPKENQKVALTLDYAATRARLGLKAIERSEVVDGLWFLV